jgi:nitrogen regulatory protein PII
MANKIRSAKVKLVTMIACWTLQEHLERLLGQLRVRAYTVSLVNGRGDQRGRRYGGLESGNVKIEALVTPTVATQLLDAIDAEADDIAVVAFVYDIEAAARSRGPRPVQDDGARSSGRPVQDGARSTG